MPRAVSSGASPGLGGVSLPTPRATTTGRRPPNQFNLGLGLQFRQLIRSAEIDETCKKEATTNPRRRGPLLNFLGYPISLRRRRNVVFLGPFSLFLAFAHLSTRPSRRHHVGPDPSHCMTSAGRGSSRQDEMSSFANLLPRFRIASAMPPRRRLMSWPSLSRRNASRE